MIISPCLDSIFSHTTLSLKERIHTVKEAGYSYFEFWTWWDKDLLLLEELVKEEGLHITAMCTRFVSLVDKNEHPNYLKGLQESIEVAKRLGVKMLISQTGNEMDLPRDQQVQHVVDGLAACIPLLEEADITLVIEPLNLISHPNYFLSSSDEAAEIIRRVNHQRIKMLFDVYHQQVTEGHVTSRLQKYLPYIGHIHVADNPGRQEPGTGELNYHYIFHALEEMGYDSTIGLEFFTSGSVKEKLVAFRDSYLVE